MKTRQYLVPGSLLLLSALVFISCKTAIVKKDAAPDSPTSDFVAWTKAEKDLIMADGSDEPMRILISTNAADLLVLRETSIKVKPDPNDPVLKRLQERMRATLKATKGGDGIAAPQVGVSRDVFWCTRFDLEGQPFQFFINPVIIFYSAKTVVYPYDGCLSVPDPKMAPTRRHSSIFVEYYNESGEKETNILEGYRGRDATSVCFQHEFDHLRGVLFTDRLSSK